MRNFACLLAAICLCSIALAQSQTDPAPYLSLPLNGSNIHNVLASTEGGYIQIVAADAQYASVQVYLKCAEGQMSNSEIEQDLKENYKFDVGMHGDTLDAHLIRISGDVPAAKRLFASFAILVPANVNTKSTTAGSDIVLNGLTGKQDLVTSGGKLVIVNVSGDIKGSTSGGDVVISGCKQNIDLSTSGGKIIATKCEGVIKLGTSGERIVFADLKGDINVTTSGGNLVGRNVTGALNASDAGGNIVLAGLSCTVVATTTKGDLYADVAGLQYPARLYVNGGDLRIKIPKQLNANLDLTAENIKGDVLQNFAGVNQNGKINGQLNSGGVKLIASDTGGTMDIEAE